MIRGLKASSSWPIWLLVMGFVLLVLSACVPGELEPGTGGRSATRTQAAEATVEPPSSTPPATATPPATPTPFPPPSTLTLTPWDPSQPPPTRTPVPPLPGLLYADTKGLWQTADDWQPVLVIDRPDALLSPDGQQAVYIEGDDIWLADLPSGERRNLTEGSGRAHCCLKWWPSRPGLIVFGSQPLEADLGPTSGFLSVVNVDGSGYTVLDPEQQSNAEAAPDPDGQTIAYDRAGTAWLYRWDAGPEPLDPAAYGLSNIVRIAGPSWSPDGRRLAWTVAVTGMSPDGAEGAEGSWQIALAVFDLETQTAWLLHPYSNIGRGGWFPPPAWRPNGQWLTFVAEDADPEAYGVWVVDADGSSEQYIGRGMNPVWSPDDRWLAYNGLTDEGNIDARLVETDTWYPLQIGLPADARIVGWGKPN
jgi:Tol biopolymer transport system component